MSVGFAIRPHPLFSQTFYLAMFSGAIARRDPLVVAEEQRGGLAVEPVGPSEESFGRAGLRGEKAHSGEARAVPQLAYFAGCSLDCLALEVELGERSGRNCANCENYGGVARPGMLWLQAGATP